MIIYKALLKHGYSKFKLEIFEQCALRTKDLVEREQYYIDTIKPEYNILNTAYSYLGFKYTKDSLVKIKKHLGLPRWPRILSPPRANLNKIKSISIKVTNLETNISCLPAERSAAQI